MCIVGVETNQKVMWGKKTQPNFKLKAQSVQNVCDVTPTEACTLFNSVALITLPELSSIIINYHLSVSTGVFS